MTSQVEHFLFQMPRGLMSRFRLLAYGAFGMRLGRRNRIEGGGRVRHCAQIAIGDLNAFTQGCWLWPTASSSVDNAVRIRIGNGNYFNRNVMIDACGLVHIGDDNMFGPDIYITDSNHSRGPAQAPKRLPMQIGHVKIGNRCWIGAGAIILKDVELGDGCVIGAGSVVTRSVAAGGIVAGVPARALARPHA